MCWDPAAQCGQPAAFAGKQSSLENSSVLFLAQSSAGGPGELLKEKNSSQADTPREETCRKC